MVRSATPLCPEEDRRAPVERESAVSTPLRVLLVEDTEDDATLILHELRRRGYSPHWARVEDAAAMRSALEREDWEIVLSDWALPRFGALSALALLKKTRPDIPFLIVSGTIGEETAVEALLAGAHDFILKGKLSRLAPAIERELRESEGRRARRAAEEALLASEVRYRTLFDGSPLPMWVHDAETLAFLTVNEAAIRQYGYSREEFLAMTIEGIRVPPDARVAGESAPSGTGSRPVSRHRRKDGSVVLVDIKADDFELEKRRARVVLAIDVTERLRLEEQLRQSQKMEAVGRLAGGVAHDFNNVLSVILSYGDMLFAEMDPGPVRDDIEEIRKAGRRAADLTRQLLMFSRQQMVAPMVLDLNEILTGMDRMLRRILGADVDLVSLPMRPLGRVRVDPSSMDQVIMNLVVNARDAMPTGGKLTMETSNVVLDEAYAKAHHGVSPGPHVMLAVTDTGTGMDKATLARIFEPFFTTKGQGKGTGLGLSSVLGIVQQSGGSVWVYSELGKGTTFKIYLPRVDAEVETIRKSEPPATSRGAETILLVEDDGQVRRVAKDILEQNGYQVFDAPNAGEALLLSERHPETIDLLLSDVVMPQMSGPELAKRLSNARPGLRVLCMSGYTDDSIVRHGVLESHIAYLQKPITPETLTRRVREVLDQPVEPRS
jgi:two-component system, cell cycle sensor histidine kinase and response regulator CckA